MYQFATAAYAATAKLALTGLELQAEALFSSSRRLREVLAQWPASDTEIDGALDHAARVWSIVLGGVFDDPGMTEEGLEAAERLAAKVFAALQDAQDAPGPETIAPLVRLTFGYATTLRQAAQPRDPVVGNSSLMQSLRQRISTSKTISRPMPARGESPWRDRRARA